MLADIVPSASAPPVRIEGDAEGNKALIRALRQARADGDPAVVGSFYSEDFRHFMAGERPFGWDHLPLEEIYAPLVAHLASPIVVRYGPPFAEGDRVIAERSDEPTVELLQPLPNSSAAFCLKHKQCKP